MRATARRSIAATGVGALLVLAPAALAGAQTFGQSTARTSAHLGRHDVATARGSGNLVFVQTDSPSGNQVLVFTRHSDGRLSERQAVSTGGLGGESSGAVVDQLASQDSLVFDAQSQLLFAVNAGSDSVAVLSVVGRQIRLVQVVSSGGSFPDSIAVSGNLVYVLDAGGTGTVTGFRVFGNRLAPLQGSTRSLGLTNTTPPNFLASPGEIAFGANGSELVVTTKASSSSLDVFGVDRAGQLSLTPTVTPDPGNVPFSFTSTASGQLVVAEAANSTLHTYAFGAAGSLTSLSGSIPDGEAALCWITQVGSYEYVANAGSNTISAYTIGSSGTPALVGTTGVVAATDAGPIDMAASSDGNYLYAEAGGAGAVDEFQVNADGSLTDLGNVAGLGAGIEGIAAE